MNSLTLISGVVLVFMLVIVPMCNFLKEKFDIELLDSLVTQIALLAFVISFFV